MADRYNIPDRPHKPTDEETEIVKETMQEFSQLEQWRSAFANHWDEVARLILPAYRNTFQFGSFNMPGTKKTEDQVDATGMLALQRFAAICDSLLTPRNMIWHGLEATDPALMRARRVKLYFEQVSRVLFKERYTPTANFPGQNHANYLQLGAFGTHGMFVDEYEDPFGRITGLRYRSIALGELYLKENHQGVVDGFIRWFRLTAAQAYRMFGGERLPQAICHALERNDQTPFNFLHRVCARRDYDADAYLTPQGKPWSSCYVSVEGKCLMEPESGYYTFPLAVGRYVQTPGEVYGRSPAMMVLPALKTLNFEKKVFLKQGHRAAEPILLTADDGLVDGISFRPGALNKGGWSMDGHPMVGTLPVGDVGISKEMMQDERLLINDAFLVTLFQILTETPQMTATEVIERTNEKGILLAPTVGRQQGEYLGTLIDRELDILARQRKLPPMPPELREAKGEYQVVYTSPLSRAMRAQEAAGFMRTLENVRELVAITQDPSLLDPFDFDMAIPAIAEIQAVPESWMADQRKIAAKRQARARAMAAQQQMQRMPAEAAMMKAQATVMKAQGGPTGSGALSPASQGRPQFAPMAG